MELWLLVPTHKAEILDLPARTSIGEVAHRTFSLCGPIEPSTAPPYACVSYAWGAARTNYPLDATKSMSEATIPSFAAAITAYHAGQKRAEGSDNMSFWVDVFCIPFEQPQRTSTLASMGFIFAKAQVVISSLSRGSVAAMQQMRASDRLDEGALLALETEPWIESVWTYQEAVNCQQTFFVCHNEDSTGSFTAVSSSRLHAIEGSHFFNCVGMSLTQYRKHYSIGFLEMRQRLPRLDAFDDLMADCETAMYEKRPILQVISNLDRRNQGKPKNTLFSMMGAISQEFSQRSIDDTIESIASALISVCVDKGDFSFLYTANERKHGSCAPVAEVLHSVVPWHSWGQRQSGHIEGEYLVLENVILLDQAGQLTESASESIFEWLRSAGMVDAGQAGVPNDNDLAWLALASLRKMGYMGSDRLLRFAQGYFFVQQHVETPVDDSSKVFISGELSWTFGNPGMAKRGAQYVSGVFFGFAKDLPQHEVTLAY